LPKVDLLVAILVALVGLAALVVGYRLFRLLLPVWGFVVGFFAGAGFIANWLGEGFLEGILGIGLGVLLGIALAFVAYALWWIGVVIALGGLGFALGYAILPAIGLDTEFLALLLGLAVGSVLAVAAILLHLPRALIVVITSLWGSAAVIGGVLVLFNQVEPETLGTGAVAGAIGTSFFWTVVWIALAVIGMGIQWVTAPEYELYPLDDSMGTEPSAYRSDPG
jgi:Domain of unknown function (DUF4203)